MNFEELKMTCGNCTEIEGEKGNYYCSIRFILKDGKRIGNKKVIKGEHGCKVFLPSHIYNTKSPQSSSIKSCFRCKKVDKCDPFEKRETLQTNYRCFKLDHTKSIKEIL